MKHKYLPILILGFLLIRCTSPDEILNDFQVHVTPEFYSYVVQVEVEDLTDANNALPSDLEVEITGPDAGGVYYTDGTKNFRVFDGFLQMFVAREFEPVSGDPVDFDIVLSADGYRTNNTRVSIVEGVYSTDIRAQILNLDNLPTGINSNTSSGSVDPQTNALSQNLTISAATSDSTSSAEITVPAGTRFLDASGNVILGKRGASDLNVNVLSVSDTSRAGQQSYPGGTGLFQRLEVDGQIETSFLPPSPSFDISMDLGGEPVASLDGGKMANTFSTKVYINPDRINPITDQPYQDGDEVGLIYYDNERSTWRFAEGTYLVQTEQPSGKLYVILDVAAPGPIKISVDPQSASNNSTIVRISGFIEPTSATATPSKQGTMGVLFPYAPFQGTTVNYGTRLTGSFYTSPNDPRNPKTDFSLRGFGIAGTPRLLQNVTNGFNGWTLSVDQITPAPTGYDFHYAAKAVQVNQGVTVGFTLQCDGAFIQPPAGTILKYREHSAANGGCASTARYQTLFIFDAANVGVSSRTLTELEAGKFYDFRAQAAGEQVDTCNVKIIDNHIYNVVPPQRVCNQIGL